MAIERRRPDEEEFDQPQLTSEDDTRKDLGQIFDPNVLETERSKRSPFAKFAYVDVTFGTANTDYIVTHTLATSDPEEIRWWVVKNDTAGVVYRDAGTPPRSWGEGYVVLKCSVANANVRLLLFVEQI